MGGGIKQFLFWNINLFADVEGVAIECYVEKALLWAEGKPLL